MPKKDQEEQAIGKSRGGLTTKIHACVDALGHPIRLLLTPGQASEYGQAQALIDGFSAEYVVADKGYDANEFIETIEKSGATPVVPPRSHRKAKRNYDKELYKERNLVERFFMKIKNFRRIATRYERLERNYMAMLNIAALTLWLK